MESEIRQLVNGWMEAWNAHDIPKTMSFYADNCVLYQAPQRSSLTGKNYIEARFNDLLQAAPDWNTKVNALHVVGNNAIVEITNTGTHTGPFLGYEPTNNKFEFDTCIILNIQNGVIVKQTAYLDMATILRSVGLITIKEARPEAA